LAFQGTQILAASHRQGVLRMDLANPNPGWQASDVRCGLPLRDPSRFQPVDALAATPEGQQVMAGGREGVFRSQNGGETYAPTSSPDFQEKVTIPPTWLFCSGEHEIQVVSENEVERD
jgi:hypothetical protein